MSPREMRRMMKRMGLELQELSGVEQIIIVFDDGRKMIANSPIAYMIKGKDYTMLQAMGEFVEEKPEEREEELEISEEDAQLVASQTGVSIEEAKQALKATNGDIAQAIMLIEARKHRL